MKIMLKNKNLKNTGLYLFGNLFNKAISFITVPIFTRLLSSEEYGIVSTYSSYVLILTVIVGLSLGSSIRNAFVDYKNEMNEYISSIFTLSFITFAFFTLVAFIINVNTSFVSTHMLFMCFLQSFGAFIINSIVIKYMMEEESFKRTILLVVPNLCAAVFSIILIIILPFNKEYGRIISMFSVTSIFGIIIFVYYLMKGRVFLKFEYWKYALSISVPLILHGLSVNILSSSDRILLTFFKSASETGIYSVVYNFGMISIVITSSLESVWIPFFTKKMLSNDKDIINRSSKIYIEICTVVFCILLVMGPEVLVIFASQKYSNGIYIIAPVVLASYFQFMYTLTVNAEYYFKKTKMIAVNTIIAAVVNIILNCIFIPFGGALAAAFTTVVSYIISFVLHYLYCKKIDSRLFPFKIYFYPLIIITLFSAFQYFTLDKVLLRWCIGLIIIIIYSFIIFIKDKKLILKIIGKE